MTIKGSKWNAATGKFELPSDRIIKPMSQATRLAISKALTGNKNARSKAQKARWAKKKRDIVMLENKPLVSIRDIAVETNAVTPGKSAAKSSKKSLYYHDIPPELYRRAALRYTVGHTKHNDNPVPITMNLNWRIGLDDPLYVMDRLNHMFEHFVDFLDNGNSKDDNLGAIAWCCGFLMEVERTNPQVLGDVLGQSLYTGKSAIKKKNELQRTQK